MIDENKKYFRHMLFFLLSLHKRKNADCVIINVNNRKCQKFGIGDFSLNDSSQS